MITLYQFPVRGGLPNPSPFCMKLETYLRMADLEYEVRAVLRPGSRTGKCPYIVIDGETLTDSSLIIAALESRFGHRVDGKLTLAQRGESLAFQRLLEEHLYWVSVYAGGSRSRTPCGASSSRSLESPACFRASRPGLANAATKKCSMRKASDAIRPR